MTTATRCQPDRRAIERYLTLLHTYAERTEVDGVLVLTGYGEDPATSKKLASRVQHFQIGDIAGMVKKAMAWTMEPHRNVYVGPVIMRHGLAAGSRGGTNDIVTVFGLVADYDDADAANWATRVPLTPTYVLETSPGRFQTLFYVDPALDPGQAEGLAKRLQVQAQCDHGTGDIAHVWRIPGTLNWPNAKKVLAGRSPEPCLVAVVPGGTQAVLHPGELEVALPDMPGIVPDTQMTGARSTAPVEADDQTQCALTFTSKHGENIKRLYDGHHSDYDSQSEADSALCCHLAYWFGRDPDRMDRVFRQSGLMREKWDRRCASDGSTYGANTVARACQLVTDTYRPRCRELEEETGTMETIPSADVPQINLPTGTFSPVSAPSLLDEPEPIQPDWVWEEYLAKGGLAALIAKPKVGKTTNAYELGAKVVQGLPYLGRNTCRGPVLILAMEEHRREVKQRLRTLGADQLPDLHVHIGPLADSPQTFHQLKQYIHQHDIVLVILDTLNTFWSVQEENDAVAVTQAIKPILALAKESGAAVLLLHHARKSDGEYGDEIRGSGALFSLLDVALILKRHDVETQRKLTAISRYPETPPELIIELRDHGHEAIGDPASVGKAAKIAKVQGALTETPTSAPEIAMRAGVSRSAIYTILDRLVGQSQAQRTGTGKRNSPYLYSRFVSVSPLRQGGQTKRNTPHSVLDPESSTNGGLVSFGVPILVPQENETNPCEDRLVSFRGVGVKQYELSQKRMGKPTNQRTWLPRRRAMSTLTLEVLAPFTAKQYGQVTTWHPGQRMTLPPDKAQRVIKSVGSKVRLVEQADSLLIDSGTPDAKAVYFLRQSSGAILGPAQVSFATKVGEGPTAQYWLFVTVDGEPISVNTTWLRSKREFETQVTPTPVELIKGW